MCIGYLILYCCVVHISCTNEQTTLTLFMGLLTLQWFVLIIKHTESHIICQIIVLKILKDTSSPNLTKRSSSVTPISGGEPQQIASSYSCLCYHPPVCQRKHWSVFKNHRTKHQCAMCLLCVR